ncbi:hypothetical protein QQ045_000908 [Rhodiola kirilowii]
MQVPRVPKPLKFSCNDVALTYILFLLFQMNKATNIVDAVCYIQELQGRVEQLTKQLQEMEPNADSVYEESKFQEGGCFSDGRGAPKLNTYTGSALISYHLQFQYQSMLERRKLVITLLHVWLIGRSGFDTH